MRQKFKKTLFLILVFLNFRASSVFAYTPMEYYISLVAGVGKGFKDGDFDKAFFNNPTSLAFDTEGNRLFVADSDNNRIRVIYVHQNNRVETIAGTGQSGKQDGPVSLSTFNKPLELTYVADDRLIVFEQGSFLFRQINLKTNVVTTLASAHNIGVGNIIYYPQNNSVYYTDPGGGELDKLDLKSNTISVVFKNNPLMPNPSSLCLLDGKLYAADSGLLNVYQIDPATSALTYIGKSDTHIHALAGNDGNLYALQRGVNSIICLWPKVRKVSIATTWGFFEENDYVQADPLLSVFYDPDHTYYYSLTSSPTESKKLYISDTSTDVCGSLSSIISVKDYDFADHWQGGHSDDFDYPVAKPANTFRILVVGDSRVVTGPRVDDKNLPDAPTLLTDTYAKKMEFLLNMKSSENNCGTHFEVLLLSRPDENPLFFSNQIVPDLVKKYDIDLVLPLASFDYRAYYCSPISPEGIPTEEYDKEYVAKPIEDRVPISGPARNFYELCKEKNLWGDLNVPINDEITSNIGESDLNEPLMEMFGLPLRLLNEKLKSIKLQNGSSPQLVMSYVPWDKVPGLSDDLENFYKELCKKNNVPIVSIMKGFNVLRTSYWPTHQQYGDKDYTAYGNLLIAHLLTHALIDQKLVPFEPVKTAKNN